MDEYLERLLIQLKTPYRAESLTEPADTRVLNHEVGAREGAVRKLAKLGTPEAKDALLGAVDDPFSAVREAAIAALGEMGEPRLPQALRRRRDAGHHEGVIVRVALCRTAGVKEAEELIALCGDEWSSAAAVEGLERLLKTQAAAFTPEQLRALAELAPAKSLSGAYDYRELDVAQRSVVDASRVKALAAAELKTRGL